MLASEVFPFMVFIFLCDLFLFAWRSPLTFLVKRNSVAELKLFTCNLVVRALGGHLAVAGYKDGWVSRLGVRIQNSIFIVPVLQMVLKWPATAPLSRVVLLPASFEVTSKILQADLCFRAVDHNISVPLLLLSRIASAWFSRSDKTERLNRTEGLFMFGEPKS